MGLTVSQHYPDCKSNEQAKQLIEQVGKSESLAGKLFTLNPISGVPGEFYTVNRLKDLKEIVLEIINERVGTKVR